MTERDGVERTERPVTVTSLCRDLRAVGVTDGMTVMVHSSLSTLGHVTGGAQAVVLALVEVLGPDGTLMMPTHSGALTDPASWSRPPIPEAWWDEVRDEMPTFDAALTPTRSMGAVVECFRHVPGALRSDHPVVSATAVGPNASFLVGGHELARGLGESSPQARLYELDGSILLLGVTHANNTSLHLSEYRSAPADADEPTQSSPMIVNGERQWVRYPHRDDDSDFEQLGDAFAAAGGEVTGPVGDGVARMMSARSVVDFGVDWLRDNRW